MEDPVIVLISFEIKHLAIPHLKGFTSGLKPLTLRRGQGSTFTLHQTTLKNSHFPLQTYQAVLSC